ncbi:MAG: acetolactate synthase large subunit [Acidobacteriota bacterium]|nr:acetolactate synthase large subunit [Acidobacteriota bacterium]
MNGAHALLGTLAANGVTACFANPGTSEMHFVAGLDDVPQVRGVLCLFEGVATGAADGYARVTGRPAATLLHLGPGLANGWANLHNARRAHSPVLNIVGDHATSHARFDAPLQSDIASVAAALEGWQRRCVATGDVARDAAAAIGAAYGPPGRVATLVLPSDVSWGELAHLPDAWPVAPRASSAPIDESALARAVDRLRTTRAALFVGGSAMDAEQLALAQRVADATGGRVICETFPAIADRGAGVVNPERLVYLAEFATAQLADLETLVLVGAREPVAFFAYPNVASRLVGDGCEVVDLAPPGADSRAALSELCAALSTQPLAPSSGAVPELVPGPLNAQSMAAAVAATMPEGLTVADEGAVGGLHLWGATRHCPPHRWMTLTGGSIGLGLPLAVGAAIGTGRRVLAVEADGSMMYTPQALWTMAREGLDVTVVALANRSYAILHLERQRVGAAALDDAQRALLGVTSAPNVAAAAPVTQDEAGYLAAEADRVRSMRLGPPSERMLELDNPTLDLAGIARAQGVPSVRVATGEELAEALTRSYATPGPTFIEAVLPKGLG